MYAERKITAAVIFYSQGLIDYPHMLLSMQKQKQRWTPYSPRVDSIPIILVKIQVFRKPYE
jgi:hypothetical protein